MSSWRRLTLIRVLSICGSPTPGSSTEILLGAIAQAIVDNVKSDRVQRSSVQLNELDFVGCQACGESPAPEFCFLDDEARVVLRKLAQADCVLFGTPIFFDSVSSQAKAFIDRCCCFRPADFDTDSSDRQKVFPVRLARRRPGAMVLISGEQGWFEGARRCVAGFLEWVEVVNEGVVKFVSSDHRIAGQVRDCPETLEEANRLGRHLADILKREHAKS